MIERILSIDPGRQTPHEVYGLLISAIVPRPIALVSTTDGRGGHTLAPFSFFMGVASAPPTVAFSLVRRREGNKKDTLRNVEETGVFVVNVVTERIAAAMNLASTDAPYGHDEFALAGLTPLPAERVASPRVAESPLHLECRLERVVEVGTQPAYLVLGEVVLFHVAEEVLTDGRIDPAKLRPVARLGGSDYGTLGDVFSMARPAFDGAGARR